MATAVTTARRTGVADALDNDWLRFAARRLWRFVVSLWVLVTAGFLMIHLVPGDPVRAALGMTAPADLVASKRASLGLDDPILVQYWHYLQNLAHGDFGASMVTDLPVSELIRERFPATLALAVVAFVVVMTVAIPLGGLMAVLTHGGRRRGGELAFTSTSVILAAIPEFLLAVALVYVFAVQLRVLPVAGDEGLDAYVLPVASLALGPALLLARIVRVEMLAILGNDFIRTARAKRLSPHQVYLRHALPNALTATVTLAGLLLSALVAGTVLVENVFAWPGLGATIVSSILQRDYPVVQGILLVYGAGVLVVNLLVDVLLALLDPRSTIRDA